MPYMVTFDGGSKPADTANTALEAGEQAEADGHHNVMVEKLGEGERLPLSQFAIRYCSRSKRFGSALE